MEREGAAEGRDVPSRTDAWKWAARAAVSAILLGWIATRVDWRQIGKLAASARPIWLGMSILFAGLSTPITSVRWRILIQVLDLPLSFRQALALGFVGKFFNAILPGSTSGDFVRIFYATRAFPGKGAMAGFSVLYDRFLEGVVLLVLGSLLAAAFYPQLAARGVLRNAALALFLLTLATLAAIPILLNCFARGHLRLPGHWGTAARAQSALEEILIATRLYRKAARANWIAVGLSVLAHGSSAALLWALMQALRLELPFWLLVTTMVVVNVAVALPVSISGLGIREGALLYLLGSFGVSREEAVAFSLLLFVVGLVWSLIGGIVYLYYRASPVGAECRRSHNR
ncbi:lysylphosphatidylglycerol synthase transmembrane domain-containing protein [Verrucomicrobium sp. 3C]|uniref:lysylphosphatidylglycerol synthase transmembrane domain-containing protein n=1 Tax=Verrucomicrobium sp. 3C TaxID=1134055 RepID=UPI000369CDAB|nr:lysylphosphatidylglycerol synthase transmembrane domain-containing protein [Verrucomicrobium sp. 3C]